MNGDNADAAAAAAGKGMAIVFVNDQAVPDGTGPTSLVPGIGPNYVNLINAVAAANPNTSSSSSRRTPTPSTRGCRT